MFSAGNTIIDIASKLSRSRNWVYKWTKRSQDDDEEWYLNKSKEPHSKPRKFSEEVESEIIKSRLVLQRRDTLQTKYAFCGAVGIHQDLDRKNIQSKPSLSTINRVLKRNDLVNGRKASYSDQKRVYYPSVKALHPGYVHQLDIVTPLYITGYGKVSSINRIDVFTSHTNLYQYDGKNANAVISFIIDDWKKYGIPRFLQVDNEGAFRGGLYHPRSFGKLVRFCLNFGVEMIFIPFNEPWRNGHIESLNGRFQDLVWNKHRVKNLQHLRNESIMFREQHNSYQVYRKQNFSKQRCSIYTTTYLPENFSYNVEMKLPITTGRIHFIRRVEEDGGLSILNERFFVDKNLSYEYVWVVLNTREQSLSYFHKPTKEAKKLLVKKDEYSIREKIKNRISIKHFLEQ